MKSDTRIWVALIVGVILGGAVVAGVQKRQDGGAVNSKTVEAPLYWVAPMDSNYRRNEPGKSPMGMDLIPVYDKQDSDSERGTVMISPAVINNLGVRTAVVKRDKLRPEIRTVGFVKYNEDKLVHIHARVEGWIEKLYVKSDGELIEKGQPLYEIYSPALVNAQEELLLALERKNQRLIQAAEARLGALQLPARAIQAIKRTRKVRQTITFLAPQSGVVDNLSIREGFFVKPDKTLMSIGSLLEVWVEAGVFERQASGATVGTPVTMTLDYLPGRKWQGEIDYVYPILDPVTRTVIVRLRFANKDQALKPNMYAEVTIHARSDDETLLVPRDAVIRTGNKDRVVLALSGGRFKSVEVALGRSDEEFMEIVSGLLEGDRVVVSAQFLLDSESSKTSDFLRMSPTGQESEE